MGTQSNAQREIQLLAEWLTTLPSNFQTKTHVRVGSEQLVYQGIQLTPSRARAFEVWSDWADARVYTGVELWLVEAKIVGTAGAYGQVLDYADEYPDSADGLLFAGVPIVPLVLVAYEKPRTRNLFAGMGVRTVVFTPAWARATLANKIVGSASNL